MSPRRIAAADIPALRLALQCINRPAGGSPGDMVQRLIAVQSQDFAGATWAIGLRLRGCDAGRVERAFNDGGILRTHLLRPTWHFVSAADIRWLLMLTAPHVHARNGTMYRKLGLDARTLRRSTAVMTRTLEANRFMTRDALRQVLERARISTDGLQRMTYIMMNAELEGALCSGPRVGKQFTYALLEQRAAPAAAISRDEALARLAGRYFARRGPATVHDLAKWSGLMLSDARRGLDAVRSDLVEAIVNGVSYWMPPGARSGPAAAPRAHLLSVYDEYISSYRGHGDIVSPEHGSRLVQQGNALAWVIVLDGRIVGTSRRVLGRGMVAIEATLFVSLAARDRKALEQAAERYGDYLRVPARLSIA